MPSFFFQPRTSTRESWWFGLLPSGKCMFISTRHIQNQVQQGNTRNWTQQSALFSRDDTWKTQRGMLRLTDWRKDHIPMTLPILVSGEPLAREEERFEGNGREDHSQWPPDVAAHNTWMNHSWQSRKKHMISRVAEVCFVHTITHSRVRSQGRQLTDNYALLSQQKSCSLGRQTIHYFLRKTMYAFPRSPNRTHMHQLQYYNSQYISQYNSNTTAIVSNS